MHLALANPCENTISQGFPNFARFPQLRARHSLLSLVLLNVFTLFVVTILKPIVSASANFRVLSIVCPTPDMPTNLRRNTVTQLFQEHKIVCNLPDFSCSHIFFCLVEKYFFPLPHIFTVNERPLGGRPEPAFRFSGSSNPRQPRSPQNTGDLINELRQRRQKSRF